MRLPVALLLVATPALAQGIDAVTARFVAQERQAFDHYRAKEYGKAVAGFERRAVWLPPRSLYRLEGPARWEWEHSILPVERTRRSITLRTMRD